jgi:hypothetical protein
MLDARHGSAASQRPYAAGRGHGDLGGALEATGWWRRALRGRVVEAGWVGKVLESWETPQRRRLSHPAIKVLVAPLSSSASSSP